MRLPLVSILLVGVLLSDRILATDLISSISEIDGTNGARITLDPILRTGRSLSRETSDLTGDGFADLLVNTDGAVGVPDDSKGIVIPSDLVIANGMTLASLVAAGAPIIRGSSKWDAGSDYNGDGVGDLLTVSGTGQLDVLFGPFQLGTDHTLGQPWPGFRIVGVADGVNRVNGLGDINNDGLDEVWIGSQSFGAYIIFGRPDETDVDVTLLNASDGLILLDPEGSLDAAAGSIDVNGDNIDDFAVGSPFASAPTIPQAGVVRIVFGRATPFPASLDVTALSPADGVVLFGDSVFFNLSEFGEMLALGTDVDGDGLGDLLVGHFSSSGTAGAPHRLGTAYVIPGRHNWPATVDLETEFFGRSWMRGIGSELGSTYGGTGVVTTDINADGLPDLISGAGRTDVGASIDAGAINILYGGRPCLQEYDFADLDPGDGRRILGDTASETLSLLQAGGDINKDGVADLLIGNSSSQATFDRIFVVYGGSASADLDFDSDGVPNPFDNCTTIPNPDQRDNNEDGFGNVCDADFTDDGSVNFDDLAYMKSVFFSSDPTADLNGDAAVNFIDLQAVKEIFFSRPGPTCRFAGE